MIDISNVDAFMRQVAPPDYDMRVPEGVARFDGPTPFVDALAISLLEVLEEKDGSRPFLEALREKYPEAVEAHMQEAENMMKEAMRA